MIRKPQLVLIDGAPGLGKTTAVANLADALRGDATLKAVFCHEYDHPLHAFWTWGDGYDPNEVVTDPFSAEKFIVRLLARTYAFVDQVLSAQMVAVLETYPFQSPVRNMLKMLGTERDCAEYISRFSQAVAGCRPLLVYFEHDAWGERIRRLAADRGDRFKDLFFEAFYRSPWGRKHGAHAPEDVIAFYKYYLGVCDRLLDRWPFRLVRFDPLALGPKGTTDRILVSMQSGEPATEADHAAHDDGHGSCGCGGLGDGAGGMR
jgi:hypothetical protein